MDRFCQNVVREHDKDRFLTTLFAPFDKQQHLFALYAFNCEVCRIPTLVSEPQLGEIRLQWWVDTLAAIGKGEIQDHPVAVDLARAIKANGLPIQSLVNLVQAHQFDLYADQMPSMGDLEGYLGETEAALVQLACLILSPDAARKSAEASGYAGVAFGLANVVSHNSRHTNLMPRGDTNETLLTHFKTRLAEARCSVRATPKVLLPAFLHLCLAPHYAKSSRTKRPPLQVLKQWAIWRAARNNKV
jgi:Squalene/phytoene synthase